MTENNVTPRQARELLGSGNSVYLDVRTEDEFVAGHVPGALNIPLAQINLMGAMELNPDFIRVVKANLPRDARLIVGCKSGGRSAHACELLAAEGYTHACNMVGGFVGVPGPGGDYVEPGWSALGYPVETGDAHAQSYRTLLEAAAHK